MERRSPVRGTASLCPEDFLMSAFSIQTSRQDVRRTVYLCNVKREQNDIGGVFAHKDGGIIKRGDGGRSLRYFQKEMAFRHLDFSQFFERAIKRVGLNWVKLRG